MKSLQLPTVIGLNKDQQTKWPPALQLAKFLLAAVALGAMLWFGNYFLAIALVVVGVVFNHCYRIYTELKEFDLSLGSINFTVKDIIEDIEQ